MSPFEEFWRAVLSHSGKRSKLELIAKVSLSPDSELHVFATLTLSGHLASCIARP